MKRTHNKKHNPKILTLAYRVFAVTLFIFVVGSVALNSYEMTINSQTRTVKNEITELESDIDGLTLQKQELVSFSRVSSVASAKGYTYAQSSVASAVVGVSE